MKKTPKKIIITGTSGSGKTTVGQLLSTKTGIACTDLDDLFWLPEWKPRDKTDFEKKILSLATGDEWIISGNYSDLSHITWPKADMIIWLDFPLPTLLWRTFKRSLIRSITKEPCCGGNFESFSRFFSKQTIFYWVLRSYHRRKKNYGKYFSNPIGKPHELVHLKTSHEVHQFVESFHCS
ncbi:MAG: AAA family ATPase [Chlamydiota bacterium]